MDTMAAEGKKAPWVGRSLNGEACQGAQGDKGFDYTNSKHRRLSHFKKIVGAHFNSRVEQLKGGASERNKDPAGDLEYTLRGIPNHHRALKSMYMYNQMPRYKKAVKKGAVKKFECYMQRAITFAPKDSFSYLLYAKYLKNKKLPKKAVEVLKKGEANLPENAFIHYHLSLILLKQDKHQDALKHAKLAYEFGQPPKKLKNKLIKSGIWKE